MNPRVEAQLNEVEILAKDIYLEARDGQTKFALKSARKLQAVVGALVKLLSIDAGK